MEVYAWPIEVCTLLQRAGSSRYRRCPSGVPIFPPSPNLSLVRSFEQAVFSAFDLFYGGAPSKPSDASNVLLCAAALDIL